MSRMDENKASQPVRETPERQRWSRWVFILTAVIVSGIVILFLWWLFQRPATGTITVAPPVEQADFADPAHRKRYAGKYFTFTYPYDFERRDENEPVKYPLLERVYLSRSDMEGRKISVMLQDNVGNAFEEYSSFRIRRNDPDTYAEESIDRNGLNGVLFTKTTSVFEVGGFFQHGNQVLSIVVSSPTTQNGLHEAVEAMLDSFTWKGE